MRIVEKKKYDTGNMKMQKGISERPCIGIGIAEENNESEPAIEGFTSREFPRYTEGHYMSPGAISLGYYRKTNERHRPGSGGGEREGKRKTRPMQIRAGKIVMHCAHATFIRGEIGPGERACLDL